MTSHAHPAPTHAHDHDHTHDQVDHSEILDLDATVLAEHLTSVTAWLPVAAPPRHIVDLGCGTGAGTFALLARFPEARVTAVDSSAAHLRRLQEKACAERVDDRVRTVQADLDAAWPDLGRPDLVWASASLHHMADPRRALRETHGALAPGGLLAVVELAGYPRFLPATAPEDRPGLEDRLHAASERRHEGLVPHRGADWGPMLDAAGFGVEAERTITVEIAAADSEAVGHYALRSLQRLRDSASDGLAPEDLDALDRLLDTTAAHGLPHRSDLALRTERTVWAARRA
ncbi:class I SAM-dependent methyltransferase [Streptomyces subrutilus]|uniref:Class I SAM-dependent methyltransferase n=1 Tax=Streptomyces subrutilus TaxID=36818 RepID=A0A5P2USR8_9ACTN|nr:class I SAM-dependent methyltransferase [Streptomyces subrutilus]QEU82396.1 class I SAM-dependent methyltransferase [Streptomyces subrutilus]WSJ28138.1 class I SAM-dependent methyltransferase [Streptomyces subrutilus]GGZ70611.1 hypothetical protein GCM10010371_33230 [Streptomyces subrutilus]